MTKTRLEAFSDGMMAIIITIMVLEFHIPEGADGEALRAIAPVFFAYVLSFVFLGIYWNNHHHLLHSVDRVNGKILWANLHLFFWLSLIPFVTGWMGDNLSAPLPAAVYGIVMLLAGAAYFTLSRIIIASQGPTSKLAAAVGNDFKGWLSLGAYAAAIALAFFQPWAAQGIYVLVALMWFIPDRRIEARLNEGEGH